MDKEQRKHDSHGNFLFFFSLLCFTGLSKILIFSEELDILLVSRVKINILE